MQSNIQSNMWLHIRDYCVKIMRREVSIMRKNDILLTGVVLLIAVFGLLFYVNLGKQAAATITVTVNGEVYGTYSLKHDQEISIGNTNQLVIKDGKADMIEADCPDQICVDHKAISKNKESIVCLPNKVIVEVVSGEEASLDAVTN